MAGPKGTSSRSNRNSAAGLGVALDWVRERARRMGDICANDRVQAGNE
jgi:hypothetical protein